MAKTGFSAKEKLKQELHSLGSALVSQFGAARASTNSGDLEALRLLAEGKGTCRFKVEDWTEPVHLNGEDDNTALLRIFLLLLWQNGSLEKASYDPEDLRIAREKVMRVKPSVKQNDQSQIADETSIKNAQESKIEVESAEAEEQVKEELLGCKDQEREETAEMEVQEEEETLEEDADTKDIPQEVLLAEDGTNYLVGPREIHLMRKDHYHPLFSNYRSSTEIRQRNFLTSKHLLHVRKLTGMDVYDFGYDFCQEVLEKAAPSVEELATRHHRLHELELFHDLQFPRLQRLYIWMDERSNIGDESHFQFPALPEDSVGLRWLRARLPRPALLSLLRNNAKTLAELQVEVGTRSYHPPTFPMQCDDLHVLLADCSLSALQRLRLVRGEGSNHTRADCEEQVGAVRRSLPGVTVLCDKCCVSDKSCGIDYYRNYYTPKGEWDRYA
ncbi:uncharacterized protein LOC117646700 [Thrips palmi]|uniref:Uncharacterized protein LOC117646700 n=1 Tax=Thrips palmi TaxID=161013 RepID=A0A6P8Z160_THRPL|nr:uncharacterized protein LOC117646700 [Thrips palmi]